MGSGKGQTKRVMKATMNSNHNNLNSKRLTAHAPCIHCGTINDFRVENEDDIKGFSDFVTGMMSYVSCDVCHEREEREEKKREEARKKK